MPTPLIPLLSLSLLLLGALYKYILHPLFLSPLRHIPAAHPTAPFSPLWSYWIRQQRRENATIRAAHERLGPVVRLGPREVSVNCVKGGLSKVYAGGMEKGEWYALFDNYGIPNMFSLASNKAHSHRKRMISNTYSKSHITSSAALAAQTSTILYDRLLPRLHHIVSPPPPSPAPLDPGTLDISALLSAATIDIVTSYIFGLAAAPNFTSNAAQCDHFLALYNSRRSFNFWPQELPGLTALVRKLLGWRLVPQFVEEANREIEAWTVGLCEGAAGVLGGEGEELAVGERPVVYAQLERALRREMGMGGRGGDGDGDAKDNAGAGAGAGAATSSTAKAGPKPDDTSTTTPAPPPPPPPPETNLTHTLASELLDHLAAGFDTSGITLTYLVHELSQHPALQSRLRTELLTLSPPLLPSSAPQLPDPRALDALPLLHAVLWETLRLHPAIPGPQPRVTPAGGCVLGPEEEEGEEESGKGKGKGRGRGKGGFWVPGGVRVSASAGVLHANEAVYEGAGEWRPERWLAADDGGEEDAERRREMDRWFWAFGSGGRMCVGSHLAMYQMKYIIAAIYSNYTTTIVDDTGIEQVDAYTAPPKNDKLIIRLERV